MKREQLIEDVREALGKTGFYITEKQGERGLCFDIVARRDRDLLFVKVLANVDAFGKAHADELRMIARTLSGSPIVVGERSGTGRLEDGVIYSRFGVPILSRQTFLEFLEEGVPPFVFSAPGGLYVRLDTAALRRLRDERQISLGTLADVAGVSRRTIQMYLEGMSATVDIAMRLEEFLGEPLVVPVDPFAFTRATEVVLERFAEVAARERNLFRRLESLGYEVLPTIRCPFEAFTQHAHTTLLAGVPGADAKIEQKAVVVRNIGRVVERDAVLFVERRTVRMSIEGVPLIGRDELKKVKNLESVEELIAERKG